MSDKESKKPDERPGCTPPGFIILILLAILLLSPFLNDSPPNNTSSISLLDAPSFDCQPGIKVGETIDVVYLAVRMRRSPGFVDKNDAQDSIHYMTTGDKIIIKDGPKKKDGLCWWFVEHQGFRGWTADHSREGRLLLSVALQQRTR